MIDIKQIDSSALSYKGACLRLKRYLVKTAHPTFSGVLLALGLSYHTWKRYERQEFKNKQEKNIWRLLTAFRMSIASYLEEQVIYQPKQGYNVHAASNYLQKLLPEGVSVEEQNPKQEVELRNESGFSLLEKPKS